MLSKARLQVSDCVDYLSKQGIHWKFIVKLVAWMGGFYECLVGSIKRALRKTLRSQCLTEEQLVTVLTEAEAVINSRPLVYVDDDINSSIIPTPAGSMSFHRGKVFPNVLDDPNPEFEAAKRAKSSQTLLHTWTKSSQLILELAEK